MLAELRPPADIRLDLRRPDGRLLATSDATGAPSQVSLPDLLAGGTLRSGEPRVLVSDGLVVQRVAVLLPVADRDQQLVGIVGLTQTLEGIASRIWRARLLVLAITLAELVIAAALGVLLALRLARPIAQAVAAVRELAERAHTPPIAIEGPLEMCRLAESVNVLATRLRALEEQRQRWLANTVHELGRPLGAMRTAVHVLGQRPGDDIATRRELLSGIEQAIDGMQPLLDDLALLHGQVQGRHQLRRQPVDLQTWLPAQPVTWQAAAEEKGLEWQTVLEQQLPVANIDPDQLGRAVGNLLSNAAKYTAAGGAVTVRAKECGAELCIEIADTGRGIALEEQALVFEPFFRSEQQRRFPQGLGLGLTIAREIIAAHGGHIELSSVPGQGSRFQMVLPQRSRPAEATTH